MPTNAAKALLFITRDFSKELKADEDDDDEAESEEQTAVTPVFFRLHDRTWKWV